MIQSSYLESYYSQCLTQDNFKGLSALVNYLETHQVNTSTSGFDLSKWRSSLDFYLNYKFDMANLLTFVRFYTQFVRSAVKRGQENPFTKVKDLVDMRALFGHLVDKMGTNTLIDPVTKTNPMLDLIELQAQKEVSKLASEYAETQLNSDDIARYLVNHGIKMPKVLSVVETL